MDKIVTIFTKMVCFEINNAFQNLTFEVNGCYFLSYEGNHVHVNMIGSELVFDVTSTCTRACT